MQFTVLNCTALNWTALCCNLTKGCVSTLHRKWKCSAVHCILYCNVQSIRVQCSAVKYGAVQWGEVQCGAVQKYCCTALHCIVFRKLFCHLSSTLCCLFRYYVENIWISQFGEKPQGGLGHFWVISYFLAMFLTVFAFSSLSLYFFCLYVESCCFRS